MVNNEKYSTVDTPADSEFIEFLAEVIVQMVPAVSPSEATLKLEDAGLGMARGDLYARAIEIVQGVPGP
ncbi:hypothetical protein [Glutamicibacter ardleyensis]|uniref:hypothetical protein n=1 Tax=Glutamicibacter ardleyensis TaxID=225894 RepID=UPI003FD2E800